jgi:predicted lipoprotein with Yx(FWY)xxD motif
MMRRIPILAACLSLCSPAQAALPVVPEDISLFVENHGLIARASKDSMPIYFSDSDVNGRSRCTGACAKRWPPLMASRGSRPIGDWGVISRAGGGRQWTYKHHPLYTYSLDRPDRPTGDGVARTWHLLPVISEYPPK